MHTAKPLNSNSNLIYKLIHVYIYVMRCLRRVSVYTSCIEHVCPYYVLSHCIVDMYYYTHFETTRKRSHKTYKKQINEFVIPKFVLFNNIS